MLTGRLTSRLSLLVFITCAAGAHGVAVELPARLPATQEQDEAGDSQKDDAREFRNKRAEIRKHLGRLQAMLERKADHPLADSYIKEVELLKWIESVYSSLDSVVESRRGLERDSGLLDDELSGDDLGGGQMSFIELDDLRDQLISEEDRLESLELEVDAARAALEVARKSAQDADRRRRSARDAIETESDPRAIPMRRREHELSKLSSHGYGLALRQQQLELEVRMIEKERAQQRAERYRQRVESVLGTITLTEAELAAKIDGVNRIESGLMQTIAAIQSECQAADDQWRSANRQYDQSVDKDPLLAEQLAAWRHAKDLRLERLGFLKQISTYASYARVVWRRRYQLVNDLGSGDEYAQWLDDVDAIREELARFQRLVGLRANEHFGDTATLKKRIMALDGDTTDVGPWVQFRAKELDELVHQYTSQVVFLKAMDRLLQRFDEDLSQEVKLTSARQAFTVAAALLKAGWKYEITSVDDRSITVGKSVYGVMLFVVGFIAARVLSRMVGRRVLPRFGLTQGAAQAFQSITFYLMLTCFVFLALDMINLPLTVFAFMGGAVAIGVGFGSQNILNNFISGLIVLAERPIRVGDLVEISGLTGTIERIGARSTRVKTGRNLEIIVPNSTFLENNVTNWTLSDTRIRTMVSIGVAYGSPTQDVSRLLRETVNEHEGVLKAPMPIVLFKEFGDNALTFEVHFWIHMQTMMQAEKIASDIRHELDIRCARADITIAYPQRDVHLDTLAPIEVNLRQTPAESEVGRRRNAAA